jgi:hypothetical protein
VDSVAEGTPAAAVALLGVVDIAKNLDCNRTGGRAGRLIHFR